MDINIHVVVGEAALLCADTLPMQEITALVGPDCRMVDAGWAPSVPGFGKYDALSDRDLAVLGHAIARDFGNQEEPCLLLSRLLTGSLDGVMSIAAAVGSPRFILHSLTLQGRAAPDIAPLVARMKSSGLDVMTQAPIEAASEALLGNALARNLLLARLVAKVEQLTTEYAMHWAAERDLWVHCIRWVRKCEAGGLRLSADADEEAVQRLARHIFAAHLGGDHA